MLKCHQISMLAIVVALLAGGARLEAQQVPEQATRIAPVGTGFYVEVNGFADLRRAIAEDPLFGYLLENLPTPGRKIDAWREVQNKLGMDGREIIDRYFGRHVALIAQHSGDDPPALLLTRIDNADADRAISGLELTKAKEPTVNGFQVYRTGDNRTGIAFGDGWLAMGDRRHGDYILPIFQSIGEGQKLADDPYFKAWTGMLPADRFATVYGRTNDASEFHALGVFRSGMDFRADYVGQIRDVTTALPLLGEAESLEFGPLPADTIAAATLNVRVPEVEPEVEQAAKVILAPKSLSADVLPKIDAPIVMFATRLSGASLSPSPGMDIPALGVAIKLRDPDVADDLNRILEHVRVLLNFALLQQQLPAMPVRLGEHNDHRFMIVDFGVPLAAKLQRPELAGIASFSYGTVGDWFVVTTHERAFRGCLNAADKPSVDGLALSSLPLEASRSPIGSAFVRGEPLGQMMATWLDFLRGVEPEVIAEAEKLEPANDDARRAKLLIVAAHVFQHFNAVTLQVRRGEADAIRGTLHIDRK